MDEIMTDKTSSKSSKTDEASENKDEQNSKQHTPHDSLVKKFMENPVAAQEFLEEYLPAEFKEFVDLSSIKIEKESYIEDSLKKRLSDIVYSVLTKNNDQAFIYCLLEHQSSSDHFIAFRLWQYSMLLLERHRKDKDKLPVILPLVIYNGKKPYAAPLNIWELFDHPVLAKKAMSEDYHLLDLQSMSDDDINYEKHLSFILYVMKHINDRDTLKMLKKAMQRCYKAILIDKGKDYVHTKLILWYTDSKVPEETKQDLEQLILDNLPKEDSRNIMRTIADSYIDEGVNKGIIIGRAEGEARGEARGVKKRNFEIAKRMLQENIEIKFVASVTGLTTDEILKLQNRI